MKEFIPHRTDKSIHSKATIKHNLFTINIASQQGRLLKHNDWKSIMNEPPETKSGRFQWPGQWASLFINTMKVQNQYSNCKWSSILFILEKN